MPSVPSPVNTQGAYWHLWTLPSFQNKSLLILFADMNIQNKMAGWLLEEPTLFWYLWRENRERELDFFSFQQGLLGWEQLYPDCPDIFASISTFFSAEIKSAFPCHSQWKAPSTYTVTSAYSSFCNTWRKHQRNSCRSPTSTISSVRALFF